jgi:hypothetical protein
MAAAIPSLKEHTMTDRALRFAARIIAIGLLGVAWTIGTLAMTLVMTVLPQSESNWRLRLMGMAGLLPVGVMLLYVIVSDLADWHVTRKQQQQQESADED